MHRKFIQKSLSDPFLTPKRRNKEKDFLERIDELLKWAEIEDGLSALYSKARGRPSYPPLMLFKALLLASWHGGLSDYELEDAITDRFSFRQFLGLSMSDDVPDHSTFSRFRTLLVESKYDVILFSEINRQLDSFGFILRKGTMIDASIVQAAVNPPSYANGTVNPKDPDASWTTKNNKSTFGYKAHIGVDQDSGIVRTLDFTSASIHDSLPFIGLIVGDETTVYADKAYDSTNHRIELKRVNICDGIMRRGKRNNPLSLSEINRNKELSKIRNSVERCFARLKVNYGWRRVRYIGLKRNYTHLRLMFMAHNISRALAIAEGA